MRPEEAEWLGRAIERHIPHATAPGKSVALNLGSNTRKFRETSKPHIDRLFLAALRSKGYRILHADLIQGDGIDLVGNFFDESFQKKLIAERPDVLMLCNVLEHITASDRTKLAELCNRIVSEGGFFIVTAPLSYPYHADPIDSMYRPSPDEISQLFKGFRQISSEIIFCGTYKEEFSQGSLWRKARKVLRIFFPFIAPKRWLSHAHRFLWLVRHYKISAVLQQKI